MPVTGSCGPHCGIASGREGHCGCNLCSCPQGVRVLQDVKLVSWGLSTETPTWGPGTETSATGKKPMCDRWYERSGGVKPWERP